MFSTDHSVRVGVNIGILFRAAKELFYKQKHQALLNKEIKDKSRKLILSTFLEDGARFWETELQLHTTHCRKLRIWLCFTLMSNQTKFSWAALDDLSNICLMGHLILSRDHLTWHCQNVGLVGTKDKAPPNTATSLPAPMSLTVGWGTALRHWCKPQVTGDLEALKKHVHHISQEEAASARRLG